MRPPNRFPLLLATLAWLPALAARDLHVSPAGSDRGDGSPAAPFATLERARDAARTRAGREAVTVHLADGIYYLPRTLVLGPEDSGSAGAPVVYRAVHEGKAVLSGGARLAPRWQPGPGGVLTTPTETSLAIDQLFVDGVRRPMARYPNADPARTTDPYQGYAADAISPQRAARWNDPVGGFIHAMHLQRWGGYHYRITGKHPDGSLAYEGGWQNNRQMGMHPEFRMVENLLEELDAPGEWFHDPKAHTLRLLPPAGFDPAAAVVEAVRLPCLVDIRGTPAQAVHHLEFRGLVFRHVARTFMETREPLLRSDWTLHRGGALRIEGAHDIGIHDSEFDQVGGNAVMVSRHARRVAVRGCHIHDPGASGVVFVGDPTAVRNPLFEYGQRNDLARIDREPGPLNALYPADCRVEDCLIRGIGRVERQAAGVQVSMASRITIADTTIHDCSRAGINIGDGTWGGHVIERCDVFDTVLETHDHGSFNSWGRDRYWCSDHRGVSEPAVKADPRLPFLDAVETTVIRHSRWRCDHGWDIDLDDGSSNYDIHDNLMLGGGLKFREGYRRRAWNNLLVNGGFHPHVWFADSGDRFTGNLVMAGHRGVQVPTAEVRGEEIDRNAFFGVDPAEVAAFHRFGWDRNSITGDPRFVDPAAGDFRVREGSPVLALGFRNFPMDRFGVKKPSLKALAKTPAIPTLRAAQAGRATTSETEFWWEGARLRSIGGEEFSAFGTRREDGGVQVVELLPEGGARRAGLEVNDLIQTVNGAPVRQLADFRRGILHHGLEALDLQLVRRQQKVERRVKPAASIVVERADRADGFTRLKASVSKGGAKWSIAAFPETRNEPLASLLDGRLAEHYGPVFANGTSRGCYRIDLGKPRTVRAIRSWTFAMNGNRGPQRITLYGSAAPQDPGSDLDDRSRFTPLATLDTTGSDRPAAFEAVALEAAGATSLGRFRWIVWAAHPVTDAGEHSAFQELEVLVEP